MSVLPCFKAHYNAWWLPKKFAAITLFGHVFTNMDSLQWNWYCNAHPNTVRHENIHVAQGQYLGWLKFYLLYIKDWIVRLGQGADSAYRNIRFEREAYENEHLEKYTINPVKYEYLQ